MRRKMWILSLICLGLMIFTMGCARQTKDESSDVQIQGEEQSTLISKPYEPENPPKSMTLMIYMVGSDLEAATAAATNDMAEMEASGVNLNKVKLLVYTGGSPKWHNDSVAIPTDANAVFELTKDGFVQVTDFEAMSMGEPESLSRFLQYGYENYSSEAYGLILWDHGNGPVMGYGSDLQYGKDALTLPEMEKALSDSPFGAEKKLEFIGFDACLMSSVELACIVDDYAKYMVASQEVEPGFGWNYAFLKKCCKVDTRGLMQEIVDQYISYSEAYFAENEFFKSEVTLSAVDLSYAKELEEAVDTLFEAAAEDVSGSFSQLVLERVETRAFGRATTGSEYDLVDLKALMNSMKSSYEQETDGVQSVLEQMVVYGNSNTAQSCGLSLYYPYYNKKYYEFSWKSSYEQLGLWPNYIKYLDRYGQIWLGTDMKEYFSGELAAQEGKSGTYTLQLTEEQAAHYADSGYYIMRKMGEDVYSLMYYSQNVTNEDGLLTADFDGRVLYYGDDLGFKGIPLTRALDEVDGEMRYAVFPTLTGPVNDFLTADSMLARMVLSVNSDTGEVRVLEFTESSSEEIQTGKKPQIDLNDWVRIQFYEISGRYLTRDEDGRILQYWNWPESDWILANEIPVADGLQFTYEPMYDDGGEYFLMFDIMDVQGNQYSSELYPITLEKAPPEAEIVPTDAGTLQERSVQIFDRENVQMYLELVQDSSAGQMGFCFRVENHNEHAVRILLDEILINGQTHCSETTGYLSVEPNTIAYEFIPELEFTCRLAGIAMPEQLNFSVKMSDEINDKTLINSEPFVVHFAENAYADLRFLPVKGVCAKEQVLLDEEEGIKATLLGAGYLLNRNNYNPDGDFAELTGVLRLENHSDETQKLLFKDIEVNDISMEINAFSFGTDEEIVLRPGQVYYKTWSVRAERLEEHAIEEITSIAVCMDVESESRTVSEKMAITFAEE